MIKMVKRKIINIDEEKCNGCRLCITNCPEGAIQIIDGKARLISDIFCDGLGACLGYCPQGAITTYERDAEPYNEKRTMENIVKCGENTIIAHLKHLKNHGETKYLKDAMDFLDKKGIEVDFKKEIEKKSEINKCSCSGAKMMDFSHEKKQYVSETGTRQSMLKQWPVQLHLVPSNAPYFQGSYVLLVADCVGYALADFHKDYLKDKSLTIACPKLDSNLKDYYNKLTSMIDDAKINTLTVMTVEVPCCNGLLEIAKNAAEKASRKIPIKHITISIRGIILNEEWI